MLFADVKGSMELAEQVDPEEWHRILDRFFQILADGIHRFEGTINQYTGDGIMALLGGQSAGGYGAMYNYHWMLDDLLWQRTTVFLDAPAAGWTTRWFAV